MIILASNSPRRKEILNMLGIDFKCIPSSVDENVDDSVKISDIAETLAYRKASDIFKTHTKDIVIGADTVVVCENNVLGKPVNSDDSKRMLKLLSGKEHSVLTGVSIISKDNSVSFTVASTVEFYNLTDNEIDWYISTGEPADKAGSYAIQGLGAKFIKSLNGDFYSVMGLPAARLYQELKSFNYMEDC